MITTTLNRIRAHRPCGIDPRANPLTGYQKLKAGLGPDWGEDDPIPFARIIEINGLDDAWWCCRAEPQYAREWRLFSVWCCRRVEHLMVDKRSRDALNVAERYANGQATDEELSKACAAAYAAWAQCDRNPALMPCAAYAAAVAAAWAAETPLAFLAAAIAAEGAVEAAAYSEAALAPDAALAAEGAVALERAAQTAEFLRIVTETEARA